MDEIRGLQERIAHLEKHIEEQDAEVYQHSKRIDSLVRQLKKMESRLEALDQSDGGGNMPADEKPPHY